jgi:hypothetical protein
VDSEAAVAAAIAAAGEDGNRRRTCRNICSPQSRRP